MIDTLAIALIAGSLALALLGLGMTLLDRPVGAVQLAGMAALEAALAVQVVLAIVRLAGGGRPDGGLPVFIGYLIGSLVILPIAGAWGLGDRSRWGSGVATVGYLVVAVLIVRMQQVWQAPGG